MNKSRVSFGYFLNVGFKQNPPRSISEAQDSIHRLTGIKRSPTQIRIFLKKIGMKCLKVGFVPGKAIDPEKIRQCARLDRIINYFVKTNTF